MSHFFDSPLFLPSRFVHQPENTIKQKNSHSYLSNILSYIKRYLPKNHKILNECQLSPVHLSPYLLNEIDELSEICYELKGFHNMSFYDITDSYKKSYLQLLSDYKKVINLLHHDQYDYIMVLPWLIQGGIDLFAINYLKNLAEVLPNSNFLAVLTNGLYKSFSKEELGLPDSIDIIELPQIINKQNFDKRAENTLYSLISVFKPSRLHIISSKVGFDCLINHNNEIRNQNTKILFSSYNYLVNESGEYVGYSIQELPAAYRPGDIITTDNQRMRDIWIKKYGILPDDIQIHSQLFEQPIIKSSEKSTKHKRILWAAHVRPEKNPEILPKIAKVIAKDNITIDCYGLFTPENWQDGKNPLLTNLNNLNYCGPYKNFFNDIPLEQYDLFLYTTHTDGTPNVILEAALSGLPIISSAVGGIPDVVQDKATLIKDTDSVNDFVNAIYDTLSHKELAQKKATNLQKILSEQHSKSTFIKQIKEMLERTK